MAWNEMEDTTCSVWGEEDTCFDIEVVGGYLLINETDFLLINTEDGLIIDAKLWDELKTEVC